ncbi:N-acetylmuramoyl-L-alanine amidase [Rhizobium sp.]
MLSSAYSYLGVAGTITTSIGLLALIVLAAFGLARQSTARDERKAIKAIESGNIAIVDAYEKRFSVDTGNLGTAEKKDVIASQIRSNLYITMVRYFLLFLAVVAFLLVVVYLMDPRSDDSAGVANNDTKMFVVLSKIEEPAVRMDVFTVHCKCTPDEATRAVILSLRYSAPEPATEQAIAKITGAKKPEDLNLALAAFPSEVCSGDVKFEVVNAKIECRNGEQIEFAKAAATTSPLTSLDAIVLHATASAGFKGIVKLMQEGGISSSFHLLITRDGQVIQMTDLDKRAAHVGKGTWKCLSDWNGKTIAIEFENLSSMTKNALNELPSSEVFRDPSGDVWQTYTPQQIEVAKAVIQAIYKEQGRKIPLIGHSDLDYNGSRRVDPGPAFPFEKLRRELVAEG